MTNHLEDAAKLAGRKNNLNYYCYHAWIAVRASGELIYIGIMSFIHAFLPFIYSDFELAEMLVKTINKIRVSIPDWPGWKELDTKKATSTSKKVYNTINITDKKLTKAQHIENFTKMNKADIEEMLANHASKLEADNAELG